MMATLNYRRIELRPEVPPGWESVRMQGTNFTSWEGKEGIVMVEDIAINPFYILVARIFLRSSERIELRLRNTGLCFSFCLEGLWQITNGIQFSSIKKDQYQLFFSDDIQLIPLQKPGRVSHLLIIRSNTQKPPDGEESLSGSVNATALMMDLILQLTQTSFYPQPRSFHEKLIQNIIKTAEEGIGSDKLPSGKFTNTELDALYKVCELIEKDLRQHYSIVSLAAYSGMNRQKLTTGCKSLFGQTIYTYYQHKCMQLAQTLLITSDLPIKLISKKAGYGNTSNFSIAFRKFYGITPAQMRRKKKC